MRPNRLLIALFPLALLGCKGKPAPDQAPASKSEPAAAAEKPVPVIAKPFMWRVDGKNGPSYLFGTIHVGVDGSKELPPSVWQAFGAAKTYVMEADLTKVDMAKMIQTSRLPPGEKLSAKLTPEQFALALKMTDMSKEELDGLRPWFAGIVMLQKALVGIPIVSMDMTFQARAIEQKKRMDYFEDANQQIEMFAKALDAEALARSLDQMIKDGEITQEAMTNKMKQVIAAYRSGDEKFDFAELSGYTDEKLMEILLYQRNRDWLPKLEEVFASGNAFVAVGVMHLLGEKSVISLLEAKGIHPVRVQ